MVAVLRGAGPRPGHRPGPGRTPRRCSCGSRGCCAFATRCCGRPGAWASASPAERREAHAVLAAVMPDSRHRARACALLEAATGPDPALAAELAALAADDRDRRGTGLRRRPSSGLPTCPATRWWPPNAWPAQSRTLPRPGTTRWWTTWWPGSSWAMRPARSGGGPSPRSAHSSTRAARSRRPRCCSNRRSGRRCPQRGSPRLSELGLVLYRLGDHPVLWPPSPRSWPRSPTAATPTSASPRDWFRGSRRRR